MEFEISRNPAFVVAAALAAGVVSQALARHLRVPGLIVLLAAGVLLGPEALGVVRPEALGPALHLLVGMSVAVILFEGGLNLNLGRLRGEALTIRRLVTVGALITGVGGTFAARAFMGWSWEISALFGSLVIVTGPTVITPLMRRISVKTNLRTILEGEGVLIDPVGAILAVVVLEVVLSAHAPTGHGAGLHLLGLPSRLVTGLLVGAVGGFVVGWILRDPMLVPSGLENILTLSLVLVLFEASEALQPESGIMAAAIAGIVVGNLDTHVEEELKEFKEQLTLLLIGLLFVLLAATVELEAVIALGWPGVATVLALLVVVRPLGVAVCSAGSELELKDKLFLSWIAPRGIVAAAVASLFAQWLAAEGMEGGAQLQALVFLVIAVTIVVQGGTAGFVASALGVRRLASSGYVIVGANAVGRVLARVLRVTGEEAVLVDTSAQECEAAEREGLPVVYGNATERATLLRADLSGRRGLIALTPNQALNVVLAGQVRDDFDPGELLVALSRRHGGIRAEQVYRLDGRVLFGGAVDLDHWRHELTHGAVDLGAWRFEGEEGASLPGPSERGAGPGPELLPLAVERDGGGRPVDDALVLAPGDTVYFAWPYSDASRVAAWLDERGWAQVV